MPTVVIGTAGHIDHGKTSLLRALTGIDADRLPEERARGMTIDVGYAHLAFDDGVELDFVDVPGHDRLVGNMLVGAGEIDAAMLVVAADDGPRPQTLEHLGLLDALGIDAGLAVVTKTDLVPRERTDTVSAEVADLLGRTCLAGAPVLAASASSGDGLAELVSALRVLRDRVAARERGPTDLARLAVDRVFAVQGRGVVVTGTLRGGALTQRAFVRREPGGERLRIRELQVHGATIERATGGRTAVNLGGPGAHAIRRGDVLVADVPGAVDQVASTERVLVALRRPPLLAGDTTWPPQPAQGLRLHLGTAQADAALQPVRGSTGVALLALAEAVAAAAGDHGVLREPASSRVVAGLRILDLAPPRGASRRRMSPERVAALAASIEPGADAEWATAYLDLHGALAGHGPSLDLAPDVRSELVDAALEAIATHHRDVPLSPGLPLARARATLLRRLRALATVERSHADTAAATIASLIEDLDSDGRLTRRGDTLREPEFAGELPAALLAAMDRLAVALDVPAPPALTDAATAAGCPPEGVRALQADGRIVRLGPELAWSTRAYHRLAAMAVERSRAAPLTPAAFRDATGTSRRFVLAILEDLDRRGILVRTPEGHIPGPRAPR